MVYVERKDGIDWAQKRRVIERIEKWFGKEIVEVSQDCLIARLLFPHFYICPILYNIILSRSFK